MARGSSRTKSPFTFTWTIDNFRGETVVSLDSPVFTADSIDKTKWTLSLLVPGWELSTKGHLTCVLQRERDENRQGNIYIDFLISIIDQEGVLRSVREDGCYFGMNLGIAGDGCSDRVSKNLVQIKTIIDNFEKYVPDNTLTIRCKMWKSGCNVSRTDLCFARTILDIEKRSFIWTIEEICFLTPGEKRTIHVPQYNKGSSSLQLNLSLRQNHAEEVFSIEMSEVKNLKHLFYEISNLDSEGKNVDFWDNTIRNVAFVDNKCLLFQTFISKRELIDDQKHFLTNGALILQFDFHLSFGVVWSEIENYREQWYEVDAVAKSEGPSTSLSQCQSSCSSKKVLEHLLNEGTLSDITLRAGTRSFPVHKSILSARSLIFRSKFLKETGQKPNRVLDLSSDIDEITLQNLLLYIYTNVVEDLNFGNAMELYQSAEKYQLTDLKDICSKFLMDSISRSNIFQILSLSNIYQDNKMKRAAQDFISELGNEFTVSEEWKNFKKRNLELAMETMEYMFSSNKRRKTAHHFS